MAGPVITTLLSPNPASGTWQPVATATETTLASGSAVSGTFMLRFDLGDTGGLTNGDNIQIKVYSSADGSNERVADVFTIGGGGPAPVAGDPVIWYTPPLPTADYYKVTANLIAGGTSSRNFPWSVLNLNGT